MTILPQQRGLLFRKGILKKVLLPGHHRISPFAKVEIYSASETFVPRSVPIEIVAKFPNIQNYLEIVDVPDNHIVLHRENSKIVGVLLPGRTCFWKGFREHEFIQINLDDTENAVTLDRSILLHPAVRDYVSGHTVEPWQQGLLFVDKTFVRVLESGNYFFWKGTRSVNIEKVDLRQQQIEVVGQEIMSRDKVPLRLNFFCQYRISDVKKAAIEIKEYEKQLHVILQLALREYIGSLSLDEILEKKEEVGRFVGEILKGKVGAMGIELGVSGIKDVILPGEIRDIINQVLIAEKKSQANVIMRREETASTRSLLNTAKLMEENEVLYRLKELEYIERISEKISQITLSGGTQIADQLREIFVPSSGPKKSRT